MKAKRSASTSSCAVARGEINLEWYAKIDKAWREVGLAAPARRALIDVKLMKLSDLTRVNRKSLSRLHGVGPAGVRLIERAMREQGISFGSEDRPSDG